MYFNLIFTENKLLTDRKLNQHIQLSSFLLWFFRLLTVFKYITGILIALLKKKSRKFQSVFLHDFLLTTNTVLVRNTLQNMLHIFMFKTEVISEKFSSDIFYLINTSF